MDLAALRRWWPLVAVIGLLFIASLAATRSTPQLDRIQPAARPQPTATVQLEPDPESERAGESMTEPEASKGLPDWAAVAVLVLLAVLLVAVIALIVVAIVRDRLRRSRKWVRRRPAGQELPGTTADELVAALDAGLLELSDTDADPRRAVIACWLRLEQAAAVAGTPPRPGDTPGELVGRLLAEQHVTASVLGDLAAVYREARYATHTVDESMRADASRALQRLRFDLAAEVSG